MINHVGTVLLLEMISTPCSCFSRRVYELIHRRLIDIYLGIFYPPYFTYPHAIKIQSFHLEHHVFYISELLHCSQRRIENFLAPSREERTVHFDPEDLDMEFCDFQKIGKSNILKKWFCKLRQLENF